jgi:hypothetical protein
MLVSLKAGLARLFYCVNFIYKPKHLRAPWGKNALKCLPMLVFVILNARNVLVARITFPSDDRRFLVCTANDKIFVQRFELNSAHHQFYVHVRAQFQSAHQLFI